MGAGQFSLCRCRVSSQDLISFECWLAEYTCLHSPCHREKLSSCGWHWWLDKVQIHKDDTNKLRELVFQPYHHAYYTASELNYERKPNTGGVE